MSKVVRRRNPSVGPVIVLLVLSHSVWNTLQCVTSPPNIQRAGEQSNGENFDARVSRNRSERDRPHQQASYFTRNSRPNTEDSSGESLTFQVCHNRLTNALNQVCNGRYHDPNLDYLARTRTLGNALSETGRRTMEKRGELQFMRRVPRSLVDECCKQECSHKDMQKYCGFRNRPNSHLPNIDEQGRDILIEPEEPPQVQSADQVKIVEEPESPLLNPFLHLVTFFHKMYAPPTTKPPSPLTPEYSEDQMREPSLPLARVQDDPSQSRISSSSHVRSGESSRLGNAREHQQLSSIGRHNGEIPPSSRNLQEEIQPESWSSPQRTTHQHHRESGANVYISSIPSEVIPLGRGTYDYLDRP